MRANIAVTLSHLASFPLGTHGELRAICNLTMSSVAQTIFRNDDITASGKWRYIAVRLFRCRTDFRGRSMAGPPPYNSLYERGKTAIPSPHRIYRCNRYRRRRRHRRCRKSTTSLKRPVFNVVWKFPRRRAHPEGSSFPLFIDRRTKGNSFCPMENR